MLSYIKFYDQIKSSLAKKAEIVVITITSAGATNTTNKQINKHTHTMEATQWWSLTVIYHLATSTKVQTSRYTQIFSPNTDNPQKTVYHFKLANRRARLPQTTTGHMLLSKWPQLSALSTDTTLDQLGSSMSCPRWKKCRQRQNELPSIVQMTGASYSQWKSRNKAASVCNFTGRSTRASTWAF